jgi:putative transposon-encoded protein
MKRVEMKTTTELFLKDIQGFYVRKVQPFGDSVKDDCQIEHLGRWNQVLLMAELKPITTTLLHTFDNTVWSQGST